MNPKFLISFNEVFKYSKRFGKSFFAVFRRRICFLSQYNLDLSDNLTTVRE